MTAARSCPIGRRSILKGAAGGTTGRGLEMLGTCETGGLGAGIGLLPMDMPADDLTPANQLQHLQLHLVSGRPVTTGQRLPCLPAAACLLFLSEGDGESLRGIAPAAGGRIELARPQLVVLKAQVWRGVQQPGLLSLNALQTGQTKSYPRVIPGWP